jgi:GT2 family glycosyltransferase
MNNSGSMWVGLLDLADDTPLTPVGRPVGSGHRQGRVLVRMHQQPLGYIRVPTLPEPELTQRARQVALATLAGPLRRHTEWDSSRLAPDVPGGWLARSACPRTYRSLGTEGVTIVVPTRDRTPMLRGCLRALQGVTHDPIEMLVIDNGPSDTSTRDLVTALARSDPRIRYIYDAQPGVSRAGNRGLAEATFDIVAFMPDDALADPGWPSALAAGFALDPQAVCITGLVASAALDSCAERYFDARYPWGEFFEPRRYDLAEHRDPSPLYPFRAGLFGSGANCAVRRSAVARLGGLDPLLGPGAPGRGAEDLDMFLRLILAGGRICYLPAALVWHRHRADTHALGEQIYGYGHGLGAYLAKHVMNRNLPAGVLVAGTLQAASVLSGRQKRAIQASQLRAGGRRLALRESAGVLAGALAYVRAVRAARPKHGGP